MWVVWGVRGEGGGGWCRLQLGSEPVYVQPLQAPVRSSDHVCSTMTLLIPAVFLPLASRSNYTTQLVFKLGKPSWAQFKAGNNCKIMIGVRITYGLKATNH